MTAIDCRDALEFRSSEPNDAATIHLVWTRSIKATHRFLSLEHFEELSQLIREDLATNGKFTLAICEKLVLGFLGMTDTHINYLFLDPLIFRQGVGTRLIERARLAGGPLTIDINEQNPGARVFCVRRGFEAIDRSELDPGGRPYPILHMREKQLVGRNSPAEFAT